MAPLNDAQNSDLVEQELAVWNLEDEIRTSESLRKEDINTLRDFCLSLPKVDSSIITSK